MKIPAIPAPNMLAAKAVAVLLVLSVTMFGGCRWQAKLDKGDIAEADAKRAKAGEALKQAADALNSASQRFREIDAQSAANLAAAAERKRLADAANETALNEAAKFLRRRMELEAQAAREAASCPAGEVKVCGTPLR